MAKHTTRHVDLASQIGVDTESENPVYKEDMDKLLALIPEGHVQIDIGFPPYWKADAMTGWRGEVLMRDERDPTFVRYHIKNTGPALDCRNGPVDDGEIITVGTGQIFTIGAFAALPLDRFFGCEITVLCVGSRKLPANKKRDIPYDLWTWKLFASKEVEALIISQRKEDMLFLREAQRKAEHLALAEIANINVKNRLQLAQSNATAAKSVTA